MNILLENIHNISSVLWGLPLVILIMTCGVYLTIKLRFIQFRKFGYAIEAIKKNVDERGIEGDVSSIASVLLALAATVGMGNIIGVAAAIKVGGPGALFWIWVAGILGMAIQYAEAVLSVKYRVTDTKGRMLGGPMIYLEKGLNLPLLGKLFAFFMILSALFGTGNLIQSLTIVNVFNSVFNIPVPITAVLLGAIVAFLAFTGIKNITRMAVITIPFIIALYVFGALVLILLNIQLLPKTLIDIFVSAFSFKSLTGGAFGVGIILSLKEGVRRGIFSSEVSMGSSGIAAATARASFTAHQGAVFMLVTFVDAIVINTLTGLLILFSGAYKLNITTGEATYRAFGIALNNSGFGEIILTVSVVFFALTTLIIWQYYGERCVVYLFGDKVVPIYKVLFVIVAVMAGFIQSDIVFKLTDTGNALMMIPNIIAIFMLTPVVVQETTMYFRD